MGTAYDSSLNGVFIMLDFLHALDQGGITDPGKRVVIIHNGMEGLELARKCRAMGSEKVTLVTRIPSTSCPPSFKIFRNWNRREYPYDLKQSLQR